MSDVDVAAIHEALSKATPGPWDHVDDDGAVGYDAWWVAHCAVNPGVCGPDEMRSNAELIVLLRNNAEALLDELDSLRWQLQVARFPEPFGTADGSNGVPR